MSNVAGSAVWKIGGMDCTSCKAKIEKVLAGTKGVKASTVQFMTQKLEVTFDPDETSADAVESIIVRLGYTAQRIRSPAKDESAESHTATCCSSEAAHPHSHSPVPKPHGHANTGAIAGAELSSGQDKPASGKASAVSPTSWFREEKFTILAVGVGGIVAAEVLSRTSPSTGWLPWSAVIAFLGFHIAKETFKRAARSRTSGSRR